MKGIVPVVLTSLLSAFVAVFIYQQVHTPDQIVIRETLPVAYTADQGAALVRASDSPVSTAPRDFVMASSRARQAVVSIQARTSNGYFWRNDQYSSSSGSGVVVSPDGYIATNKHVIDEGDEITVTLHDQREFKAEVVGKDANTDLALIKIDASKLPSIEFGNSDSLYVGDWVLAIGNPFRLQSTVTAGIVSAKGRSISILENQTGIEAFIQTDAAVNPGNSGGALVNADGELVGINTAIITYSGQYEGFSFAVPSNLARKVLGDLKTYGSVQRGWMGVQIRTVDDELAKALRLPAVSGVFIDAVNPTGAANASGLQSRDVIVAINGQPVAGSPDFMEQVGRLRPGDKIDLDYIRDGKERSVEVVLSHNPYTTSDRRSSASSDGESRQDEYLADIGFRARNLTGSEVQRLDKEGVIVESVRPGSTVDRINLMKKYIITSVNGRDITSVDELYSELKKADDMVIFDGFYEEYEGKYPYAFRKE